MSQHSTTVTPRKHVPKFRFPRLCLHRFFILFREILPILVVVVVGPGGGHLIHDGDMSPGPHRWIVYYGTVYVRTRADVWPSVCATIKQTKRGSDLWRIGSLIGTVFFLLKGPFVVQAARTGCCRCLVVMQCGVSVGFLVI